MIQGLVSVTIKEAYLNWEFTQATIPGTWSVISILWKSDSNVGRFFNFV